MTGAFLRIYETHKSKEGQVAFTPCIHGLNLFVFVYHVI